MPDKGRSWWLDRWVLSGGVAAILVCVAAPLLVNTESLRTVTELVLLPLVLGAFLRRVDQVGSEREQAFWIRLGSSFFFLWLAALLSSWSLFEAMLDAPQPLIDALRLLSLLPVGLALDLRPHRQEEEAPRLLRQLQSTALFLTALLLAYYTWLGPRFTLSGGHLEPTEQATLEWILAALFAFFAVRRKTQHWRLAYGLGSLYFLTGGVGAFWPAAAVPSAVTAWLAIVWARSRTLEAGDAPLESPALTHLRLAVPIVGLLPILPAIHLTFVGFDPGTGDTADFRHWLVLMALLVLAPMAWLEHLLLQRRSSFLELERRRATDETVERSVYLDSLIEHSPLAIVVLDPQHRVQLINPAFEQLFDYRSDEVVGSTLDRLISTDQRRAEASGYTRSVLDGRSVHVTTRRRRRDGTELDVELYGVPLMRDGQLLGIFAIYQDVTHRLQAETALRESEERFRRLADASFEGIVVSENEHILDCNEQYASLMGLGTEAIIGRSVLDFVAPQDRRLVLAKIRQSIELPYEHRAQRNDGSLLVVEVHGRSVPYGGRTVRVTAVRDMTEHKRLEEEVRQAQKMEAVGRLAGGIAHDFNNLLTVIKGYAQLLSMQMEQGKLKGLVDEILQASQRASLMTQRLLAFGRKQAVLPQNLDLNEMILGMEKILRRLIRADIAFDIRLAKDLGRIKADPSQIEQVILNLAINAGDAMPKGGTLRLETSCLEVEEGATHGPLTAPGRYVQLTVADTGLGMDPATLSQVFEPFFTTKAKGKGTGLGLATVYAIIQQSGGALEVTSELDQGTVFRIYLPHILDQSSTKQTLHEAPRLPTGEEMVMVVEDQPGVRALAVEFLQRQGYRVVEASDGRDGLRCFERHAGDIDLVLTDVVMPEMNGPEMVRTLRERHPLIKVLYMSGYTDEMLGLDDPAMSSLFVQKPFSVEELVNKVRRVLDGDEPSFKSPGALESRDHEAR